MIPDRLIGLAGPYDVARLGPMLLPFFGAGPIDEPEAWETGNPMLQTDNNPDLTSFLLHGEEDVLIDLSFATDFAEALTESGSEAAVEIVPGARHNDMPQREVVGELIVDWLESGDG
jgi:acetyl esterase/lipase